MQESADGVSVAIGVAAAAGLSALAFTEVCLLSFISFLLYCLQKMLVLKCYLLQIETILQLLGSAALVQLAGKKLLFAEVSSYTSLTSYVSRKW